MDESILRGFCQKCKWSIALEDGMIKGLHEVLDSDTGLSTNPINCNDKKMEPVWFLSPKQMRIVYESKEYEDYYEKNLNLLRPLTVADFHAMFLEKEPFLVAKILKDSVGLG